jgi:uncharacterized protein involved in exopolysaccharide biosynthesis
MVPQIFRSRIFFVTAFALAVLLIGVIYSVKQPSETVPEGDVSIDEAIEMRVAPSEEIASSEASDIGVASAAKIVSLRLLLQW